VQAYRCEADVIAGLEPFAREEIARLGGRDVRIVRPGALQFTAADLRSLLQSKTALAIYLLERFDVPRPKALLGDRHLRAVLVQTDAVLALMPRGTYRTFMLGAAGSGSTVMARLKAELARHTGLREVDEEGELLIRVRPSPHCPSPVACSRLLAPEAQHQSEAGSREEPQVGSRKRTGWDVLVRISPRPLATRDWRVCDVEGTLQATVAHVMALLTRPAADDVYLNLGCGSGTLLIERASAAPARRLIGCDIAPRAIACAQANIAAYLKGGRGAFELYDWDARRLPMADASVDAITADLPFGHLVGSHDENVALYPQLMDEAARVARPGTRCVLITAEVRLMERVLAQMRASWQNQQTFRVNLGGLRPAIFVLRRV
jgi:tRNA (guanine6-N2)-methyltransferase